MLTYLRPTSTDLLSGGGSTSKLQPMVPETTDMGGEYKSENHGTIIVFLRSVGVKTEMSFCFDPLVFCTVSRASFTASSAERSLILTAPRLAISSILIRV